PWPVPAVEHRDIVQVRTAAPEVVGQVGDEADPFRFADEAHHAPALFLDRERDRRGRRQPPPQEALDRAHALGAFGERLAAIDRGGGRAQGGETEREPGGEQCGRQQDLDQRESALPCTHRVHTNEAVATADANESPARTALRLPCTHRLHTNEAVAALPSTRRLHVNEAVATADASEWPVRTFLRLPCTHGPGFCEALAALPGNDRSHPGDPIVTIAGAHPPPPDAPPHPDTPARSGCTSRSECNCSRSRGPPSPQLTTSCNCSNCGANESTGSPRVPAGTAYGATSSTQR